MVFSTISHCEFHTTRGYPKSPERTEGYPRFFRNSNIFPNRKRMPLSYESKHPQVWDTLLLFPHRVPAENKTYLKYLSFQTVPIVPSVSPAIHAAVARLDAGGQRRPYRVNYCACRQGGHVRSFVRLAREPQYPPLYALADQIFDSKNALIPL